MTWKGVLLGGVAFVVAAFLVASQVHASAERRLYREPLRAAQIAAAATGQEIGTVPTGLAERWDEGDGPSRSVALRYAATGNHLLEPAFYALFTRHGEGPPMHHRDWNCLYLAAQPGRSSFDPGRVTELMQLCYRGSPRTPYSSASAATD